MKGLYEKVNVVKIIVQNSKGEVLLIREPETNEWMPSHLGLPGGKPYAEESLLEAYKRKLQGDLGVVSEPKGIFKIEELLIKKRTVLMFIFVTDLEGDTFQGEALDPTWYSKEQIEDMEVSEFTEFYNKQLLLDYLSNPTPLAPITVIDTLKYFEMDNNSDYQRWLESGKKK